MYVFFGATIMQMDIVSQFLMSVWFNDLKTWESWKSQWGKLVMHGHISSSQSAVKLYRTEGYFQGWQHDRFRCWDAHASLKPVGGSCIETDGEK